MGRDFEGDYSDDDEDEDEEDEDEEDEEDEEDDDTERMTGIADSSQRFSLVTADHTHQ